MLRLLRPALRMFQLLTLTGWALLHHGWEMVVWGNVRAGSVSLRGTTRSFRLLIRVGLWLVIALLVMLLFSDAWRRASPLLPLVFYTDSLSGIFAPQWLVPVVFGLLALAWAYLLCGGLHAPWPAKLVVLALFGLFDLSLALHLITGTVQEVSSLLNGLNTSWWSTLALLVHTAGWLALLALFALRWRGQPRPGFEFPASLVLTALLLFSSYLGANLSNRAFQTENTAIALQLTETLSLVSVFLTPFLLIAGAEMAEFAMNITQGVTGSLGRNSRLRQRWWRWLWVAALAGFLCVRLLAQWVNPALTGEGVPFRWGAVVVAVGLALLWPVARRQLHDADLPRWVIPGAAFVLYAVLFVVQVTGFVSILAAVTALTLSGSAGGVLDVVDSVFTALTQYNELFVGLFALLAGTALALRAARGRRPLPAAAMYTWLFGLWLLWWVGTRNAAWLSAFDFDYGHVSALATVLLLAALLGLLAARRLTPRALTLLTAGTVLFWVLEFQSVLSDPLSPLAGLVGAEGLFLSLSIFLNVMAAGNRFALNDEAPSFPRQSRALLYFGYALLTVSTINWLAAAHHVSAMTLNEDITTNGFIALGLPLAFWAFLSGSSTVLGQAAPEA